MAARENQGYLIAVIILVLLVLILGLLTFFGWSKANEFYEGMGKAKSDLNVEKKVREAHQIEAEILRAYVGDQGESTAEVPTKFKTVERISNDSTLDQAQQSAIKNVVQRIRDVQATYDRDMQQFIARTEDDQAEDLTWSGVVRNLISVTAKKHNELAVARKQNEQDQLDFQNKLAAQQKTLDETEKQLMAKTKDLQEAKELYQANEKKLNEALQFSRAELTKSNNTLENVRAELGDKIDKLSTSNEMLASDNETLKNRIVELTTENFDLADGRILRVAGRYAFLDIGRADGLRPNMTFSVYDSSVNNFEENAQKAKIEVLEVTGAHTARARVTEYDPIYPIKKGDNVVTPTWDPGYSVPIALAGFIDLDGDGNSDRLRFNLMIEKNGGTVVAQNDEDGKIIGNIDSSTRYLVRGSTGDGLQAGLNNAMRELEEQAEANSVPVVDLRKMMNWMGMHNRATIVRNDGKDQGRIFRERSPATGTVNSGGSGR